MVCPVARNGSSFGGRGEDSWGTLLDVHVQLEKHISTNTGFVWVAVFLFKRYHAYRFPYYMLQHAGDQMLHTWHRELCRGILHWVSSAGLRQLCHYICEPVCFPRLQSPRTRSGHEKKRVRDSFAVLKSWGSRCTKLLSSRRRICMLGSISDTDMRSHFKTSASRQLSTQTVLAQIK